MRHNSAYPFYSIPRARALRFFQGVDYKAGELLSDEPSRLLRHVPQTVFHIPEFVHKNRSERLFARFSLSAHEEKCCPFHTISNQIVRQESRRKNFENSREVPMKG